VLPSGTSVWCPSLRPPAEAPPTAPPVRLRAPAALCRISPGWGGRGWFSVSWLPFSMNRPRFSMNRLPFSMSWLPFSMSWLRFSMSWLRFSMSWLRFSVS